MTCQEIHTWAFGWLRRVQRRPPGAGDPARPAGVDQAAGWGLSACRGLRLDRNRLIELRHHIGVGWDGSHRVEREHAPSLQLPVLVLLQQHCSHQASDRVVAGEGADDAGASFDLLVDTFQ
jgi:hypothetical protein